jgi:hypothetical protein
MNQDGVFPPYVNLVAPAIQIDFPRSAPDSILVTITAAAIVSQPFDKCNKSLAKSSQRRKYHEGNGSVHFFRVLCQATFCCILP